MPTKASARPHFADRYVSLTEGSDYTGLCTKTLRRRISDGSLPARRAGGRVIRVRLSDLDNLLTPIPSARTASGQSPAGGGRIAS